MFPETVPLWKQPPRSAAGGGVGLLCLSSAKFAKQVLMCGAKVWCLFLHHHKLHGTAADAHRAADVLYCSIGGRTLRLANEMSKFDHHLQYFKDFKQ